VNASKGKEEEKREEVINKRMRDCLSKAKETRLVVLVGGEERRRKVG